MLMGSYGIGPGRVMAAVVEQRHDENGIVWPPVDRAVRRARGRAAGPRRRCCEPPSTWRRPSQAAGATCCSTTATQRPGEKFADADLIGVPVRVTVGKKTLEDGAVDVRDRATGRRARPA